MNENDTQDKEDKTIKITLTLDENIFLKRYCLNNNMKVEECFKLFILDLMRKEIDKTKNINR